MTQPGSRSSGGSGIRVRRVLLAGLGLGVLCAALTLILSLLGYLIFGPATP